MSTSLTLAELKEVHQIKIHPEQGLGLRETQDSQFKPFFGDEQSKLLQYIEADLTIAEKKILIITMTHHLKEMINAYVVAITGDEKGFQLPVGGLLSTVVFPSLKVINKDKLPFDTINPIALWCVWACMIVLTGNGWLIKEYPEKFRQVEHEGSMVTEFNPTMFENVVVYVETE